MPKRLFEFSPSVELILTNLPTVRQIQRVFDEGTIKADVKRFYKHLEERLRAGLPGLRTWQKSEIRYDILYFCPGKNWHVVKDDHVALCFSMAQCIEPAFYSDIDDPFVGVYVPSKWKHIQSFTKSLRGIRIAGFEHTTGDEDEDIDESYPFWSTVHIAPLVKQTKLDVDGLEKAILDRAKKLVEKEGKITDFISKLRRKRT